MPLLEQLKEWVDVEMAKGKAKCHVNPVVIIEDLVRENVENKPDKQGKQKTRIVFVTDPISYGEWHKQRNRYIELCGTNPVIAYSVMLQILAAVQDETIVALATAEQEAPDA